MALHWLVAAISSNLKKFETEKIRFQSFSVLVAAARGLKQNTNVENLYVLMQSYTFFFRLKKKKDVKTGYNCVFQ